MGISSITALLCLLFLTAQLPTSAAITAGTADGMEKWGYAPVRPKAHMFWWWYKSPQRVSSPSKAWPTILWLQGGPGVSGVGHGNFLEIGPLDVDLKPRNSTWLQKADLIFVDSPVGVGYSYVEDPSALVKTDQQAVSDLTELLKALTEELATLQSSPLFLVGESYGGKHAAMLGASVARAVKAGTLKLTLGGVVIGDGWISPDEYALSYPWILEGMSRLDDNAVGKAMMMAVSVKQQMAAGQFREAYKTWTDQLKFIDIKSGSVNMENLMLDSTAESLPGSSKVTDGINGIMNGVMRQKAKMIPKNLTWQDVSLQVFEALTNDFMKSAVNEVDEMLSTGVNVTVYNGQYDMICSTFGQAAWVRRLKWQGLQNFLSLHRKPLRYCSPYTLIDAFARCHENLSFYWILRAGHTVPVDQPCTALQMIGSILQ